MTSNAPRIRLLSVLAIAALGAAVACSSSTSDQPGSPDVLGDVGGDTSAGDTTETGGDTSTTTSADADDDSDAGDTGTTEPDTTGADTTDTSPTDTSEDTDTTVTAGEGEPCGAGVATCESDLVCALDVCVVPGGSCASDADCQSDTYCCDTGECGSDAVCVPYGTGPRGDVDESCTIDIIVGQFEAQTQCEWTEPPMGDAYPDHRNVLATPLVADTPHDSGSAAEIIIVSYNHTDGGAEAALGSDPNYYGVIRILNGQTCAQLESLDDPAHRVIASSPPAIADLDKDGTVEIVTQRANDSLIAFKWDASLGRYTTWWVSSGTNITGQQRWDGPAIHDLDDDGFPEVISAEEVYDGRTGVRLNTDQDLPGIGAMVLAVVGDVDGDPEVELLAQGVYAWDTSTNAWVLEYPAVPGQTHYAYADFGTVGMTAAEFDPTVLDGRAEIVLAGASLVRVYTLEGHEVMSVANISNGGPPTIGDFDNDGLPEIASAGGTSYLVYDFDCADPAANSECVSQWTRWSQPSQDASSARTGSSIFDFEGDGRAEAVYADECFTRIYDGATGDVLFSSFRTSCTWYENAVVADPDRDANTEILVGSNANCSVLCPPIDPIHVGIRCETSDQCVSGSCSSGLCRCSDDTQCEDGYVCAAPPAGAPGLGNTCRAYHPPGVGLTGLRVLRDRLDRWASSRPLWNQHVYTVTNVNDDGTVPSTSAWQANFTAPGLNNFRQNVQGAADASVVPDITGRFDAGRVCDIDNDGNVSLVAQVCNRGSKPVGAAMPATFYLGDPGSGQILCTSYTAGPVPVGGCLEVSCDVDDSVTGTITMFVNDDGAGGQTTVECNSDNNTDVIVVEDCQVN